MLTDLAECDLPGNIAYRAVACSNENILVTTTGNVIERYNITDDKLTRTGSFSIEGHSYFSNIKYSSEYGGFFYCGNVGFGFIDEKTWETTDMTEDDFSGTTSDVCVDDQGNVWFSSSKHGLLKCAHTPFRSLFKKAGLDNDVVNAVFRNEGLVYVGADHGVFLFDEKGTVKYGAAAALSIFPVFYMVFCMIRPHIFTNTPMYDGGLEYPYFFLDPKQVSMPILSIAIVVVLIVALFFFIVLLNNIFSGKYRKRTND